MIIKSTPDSTPEELHPQAQRGIAHYNRGEFFEAHEYLELAWMAAPGPERDLYQGLLQIGVAYYQIKRENYRGALKMFRRGQRNLRPLPDEMLGIDVEQLRVDAYRAESTLRSLGPVEISHFDRSLFSPVPLAES